MLPSPIDAGTRIGRYVIQHLIAETYGAWIFDAECADDGRPAVFKLFRPMISRVQINREICMNLSLTKCPNAVVGIDFLTFRGFDGILMPKCELGDLYEVLMNGALGEEEICFMAFRILRALDHMHKNGLVHCDVKPENIFVSKSGDRLITYLGDFGLTMRCDHALGEKIRVACGSRSYLAPERLKEEMFDAAVDMWAFGVTLYNMAVANMPFPDSSNEPVVFQYEALRGNWDQELLVTQGSSDALMDIIDKCLCIDPQERITAEQALDHPFFAPARMKQRTMSANGRVEAGNRDRDLNVN